MKVFWYVQIEKYASGTVKAAVLREKMAESCPQSIYKREPYREIFGEWFESKAIANAIAAQANALSKRIAA